MTVGAVLLGLALLLPIVAVVVRPLTHPAEAAPIPADEGGPGRLEPVLAALRDLDFDHQTGKVSDQDYAPSRAALLAQAAEVMARGSGSSVEDILEERVREIRRHLEEASPARSCPACGGRISHGDRFCSNCGHPQGLACPRCGTAVQAADVYCVICGRRLMPEAVSAR